MKAFAVILALLALTLIFDLREIKPFETKTPLPAPKH